MSHPPTQSAGHPGPQDEVVELCRDLIRLPSVNDGTPDTPGEAEAAEYAQARLQEVGYDAERFTTTSGRRQGVVVRVPGADPDRPALLLHGHLDVVPAPEENWTHPPFSAELVDGTVWGRGAVDMKDMDAMILAVARDWARTGVVPPRDIVILLLPDEEAGGHHGSHWLVDHRPDIFRGVSEAVGEVGGFSLTIREDLRLYLIQTAEKGIAWMRLRARGRAGHGSMLNDDNAVTALARVVARIGEHRFPPRLTPTTTALLGELSDALGVALDPDDLPTTLTRLGSMATLVGATLSDTANPTMLTAGYKVNVVPGTAEAEVDGRYLPGRREEFLAEIDRLLAGEAEREFVNDDVGLEVPFAGPLIQAMGDALLAEDPAARPVPYMLSGGTDAKAFSRLGIAGYGFAPLLLPPDLNFGAMFHGVDERVPVESLRFGVRVLDRFLRSC